MARKKKEKIIVKLGFPKDDTTLTKLYAILGVSIFLGLGIIHILGNQLTLYYRP